jgi:hypothetical protein
VALVAGDDMFVAPGGDDSPFRADGFEEDDDDDIVAAAAAADEALASEEEEAPSPTPADCKRLKSMTIEKVWRWRMLLKANGLFETYI